MSEHEVIDLSGLPVDNQYRFYCNTVPLETRADLLRELKSVGFFDETDLERLQWTISDFSQTGDVFSCILGERTKIIGEFDSEDVAEQGITPLIEELQRMLVAQGYKSKVHFTENWSYDCDGNYRIEMAGLHFLLWNDLENERLEEKWEPVNNRLGEWVTPWVLTTDRAVRMARIVLKELGVSETLYYSYMDNESIMLLLPDAMLQPLIEYKAITMASDYVL